MNTRDRIRKYVEFAVLVAIEAIFCFTPLGSIPAIGPIVMTLAMLPVIVCSLSLGIWWGTALGFITGAFSFIVWSFIPPSPAVAFVFSPLYTLGSYHGNFFSILICFVPRILTGLFPALIYKLLIKANTRFDKLWLIISAILGSLVNTFGVLGGIWAFFGDAYASIAGKAIMYIIGFTVLTNGIPEAIFCGAICPLITIAFKKIQNKKRSSSEEI